MRHGIARAAIAAAVSIGIHSGAAAQQQYPNRAITVVVPFSAGGPTDVLARLLGQHMSQTLGQQIVVENVTGGGGSIGAARVGKAAPDGYTMVMGNVGTHAAAVGLYKNLSYDPREFEPVMLVASTPMVLVVRKNLQADTLKDFTAYAMANPRKVTFGSAGTGSTSHLTYLLYTHLTKTEIQHVPYRGLSQSVNDLLSGQIDMMFDQVVSATPHIVSGGVKPIVVTAPKRAAAIANVPSSTEAGLPDLQTIAWTALFLPKGTPKPIVERINAAVDKAMQDETIAKRFAELGADMPAPGSERSPQVLGALVRAEIDKWVPLIQAAGAVAEMKLTDEEQALRAGAFGPAAQWAIEHQIKVGDYLGAEDFVPVSQAHIMADTESLGVAGVEWLERWAALPAEQRHVRIPTITDPRGTDFAAAQRLKQQPWMLELERRAIAAFEALGVLMTNTCINYQTIMPPVLGEHVAYGDTGVVIYSNSVCGARSNFEGGPSALGAALTGRTPRYGYHVDARRKATLVIELDWTPRALHDWGALGGIVGRLAGDYWQVPALVGLDRVPTSDEMKHFGAALASYGSVALFHMAGITPEAQRLDDVIDSDDTLPTHAVGVADIRAFQASYAREIDTVDLVVFSAPQLSLIEMQQVAHLLDGRRLTIPLLAVTSPQVKPDADRMGLSARIEAAGGSVLAGMCFYQSYAREMAEANGWRRLATNSAKLVNILGGYGYQPVLLSMEACVEAACQGGSIGR